MNSSISCTASSFMILIAQGKAQILRNTDRQPYQLSSWLAIVVRGWLLNIPVDDSSTFQSPVAGSSTFQSPHGWSTSSDNQFWRWTSKSICLNDQQSMNSMQSTEPWTGHRLRKSTLGMVSVLSGAAMGYKPHRDCGCKKKLLSKKDACINFNCADELNRSGRNGLQKFFR